MQPWRILLNEMNAKALEVKYYFWKSPKIFC